MPPEAETREIELDELDQWDEPEREPRTWLAAIAGVLGLILVLLVGLVLLSRQQQPRSRIATASSTTIPPTTTEPVIKTTAPTTTEPFHPSPTVAVTEPTPSPSPTAPGAPGPGGTVGATQLGVAAAEATTVVPEPPHSTAPPPPPSPVTSVSANAAVADTRAGPGDQQRVDVTVADQEKHPVAGATVLITVIYPGNRRETYAPAPTDENGHSEQAFTVRPGIKKGSRIDVEVTTSYNGHDDTTKTSWKVR